MGDHVQWMDDEDGGAGREYKSDAKSSSGIMFYLWFWHNLRYLVYGTTRLFFGLSGSPLIIYQYKNRFRTTA